MQFKSYFCFFVLLIVDQNCIDCDWIILLTVVQCIAFCRHVDEEGGEEDDTPKPDWKPPPVIPKEENRTGTNKRNFFVTTERTFFNYHVVIL